MIELKTCTLSPYQGHVIELSVAQKKATKTPESRNVNEDSDYQVNAAAMARVARYTGAEYRFNNARVLTIQSQPGKSHALHAVLSLALQHNNSSHFPLL
ncbi:jg24005 [Pararge aegeria aegeria]|uniref:Jg24005 protein n=7 Tax=Pararge aegeria TaxID=116150 RepID=A0A8S4QCC3_9NEOP|nr:jg24005 [Pararge aegeria aegeria]